MDLQLTPVEERVLGCLIEKGMTTPEYYPLSLNSLAAACNQKSNRNPVMELDEKAVVRALDGLREKGLARVVSGAELRVPKYYHRFDEALQLSGPELALLGELMLRGPQTPGELRGRASRMADLGDLTEVGARLESLASRPDGALVARLPRQPGRKESRYAHLLGGQPAPEAEAGQVREPRPEAATLAARAEDERLAALEAQVTALRDEVAELRRQLGEFRRQFE